MDEREICCCGASGWTRVIAWLQIVFNALAFVSIVMMLSAIVSMGPEEFNKTDAGAILKGTGESAYAIAITIFVMTMIVSAIAMLMGIILLKGSKERNTRYLRMWVIYTAICMGWGIFSTIVNSGDNLGVAICRLVFLVALYCFGIWVVRVHIEEIELSGGPPAYTSQTPYVVKGP